jgi:hypothetical protein
VWEQPWLCGDDGGCDERERTRWRAGGDAAVDLDAGPGGQSPGDAEVPRRGAPQMPDWNVVTMGRAGLTRWTGEVAQPVARSIARGTGQPEARR